VGSQLGLQAKKEKRKNDFGHVCGTLSPGLQANKDNKRKRKEKTKEKKRKRKENMGFDPY